MDIGLNFDGDRGLHFAHLNTRSLPNCIKDLRIYIENSNIDCLTLSETWLTDLSDTNQLIIDGYTLTRQDRAIQGPRPSGGFATYVKNGQPAMFPELLSISKKHLIK